MPSFPKFLRSLHNNRMPSLQSRSISIICRGKSIGPDDIYKYTNGRFLVDEKNQFERRYVKFDLERLCEIASSAGGSKCPINTIEKMEGGFSKALRMIKEDGAELIAKIPCLNAGPAMYTTASEVAVMKYVQTHTTIPVPEIFAWSADSSNPVGAEYIIMQKAPGVQLFKVWDDIDESTKLALIEQLAMLESQLASIEFPAFGSLYLSEPKIAQTKQIPVHSSTDTSDSYFVGPSCDRSWLLKHGIENTQTDLDTGPWSSLAAYGEMLAKREIYRILNLPRSNPTMMHHGTISEQIALLETSIVVMKTLAAHPPLARSARPILWHTDLHMGNIFVSEQDPKQILSLIDWQSVQVAPAFLQVRWPEFLKPPKTYATGFIKPKLPDSFDQLPPEEQELARYEWKQATNAKVYEVSSFLKDRVAYDAMTVPRVFRELFVRCGETWEEGSVPLRACLIEVFSSWAELGISGHCPFSFRGDEMRAHERQFEEYEKWHKAREFAKEYLDTDDEGWIPPGANFAEKCEHNKELLNLFADRMAGDTTSLEARKMWPFLEDAQRGPAQ